MSERTSPEETLQEAPKGRPEERHQERFEQRAAGPEAPRATPPPPPPQSVEEALLRAMDHARNAMAEGLLAGRALIDAACLGIFGEPARLTPDAARNASDARVAFAAVARGMDELASKVRSTDAMTSANETLVRSMLDALDTEIGRWERRSAHDADARAVLRAFLGLREILWEFGLRRGGQSAPPADGSRPASSPFDPEPEARAQESAEAPRVQRVKVQG